MIVTAESPKAVSRPKKPEEDEIGPGLEEGAHVGKRLGWQVLVMTFLPLSPEGKNMTEKRELSPQISQIYDFVLGAALSCIVREA